jgi:hypothetical protein
MGLPISAETGRLTTFGPHLSRKVRGYRMIPRGLAASTAAAQYCDSLLRLSTAAQYCSSALQLSAATHCTACALHFLFSRQHKGCGYEHTTLHTASCSSPNDYEFCGLPGTTRFTIPENSKSKSNSNSNSHENENSVCGCDRCGGRFGAVLCCPINDRKCVGRRWTNLDGRGWR